MARQFRFYPIERFELEQYIATQLLAGIGRELDEAMHPSGPSLKLLKLLNLLDRKGLEAVL